MKSFILAVLFLLYINIFIISFSRDITPSMDDTLKSGDVFITLTFWYGIRLPFMNRPIIYGFDPAPDDILVFKSPLENDVLVKRCVAVGGQTVEITAKKLFVDDVEVPLPAKGKHTDPEIIPAGPSGNGKRDFWSKATVPGSTIFVLGDNRDSSFDSRMWGFLPIDNLRGKAWLIIWSTDPSVSWSNIKQKVRWGRMFRRVK